MVLEDNYSSSPPVVSKNTTVVNMTSIKALSVWDGALVVNGDSWSRASQKYNILLSVELPYGQIYFGFGSLLSG